MHYDSDECSSHSLNVILRPEDTRNFDPDGDKAQHFNRYVEHKECKALSQIATLGYKL
jgi:hypothetical protein